MANFLGIFDEDLEDADVLDLLDETVDMLHGFWHGVRSDANPTIEESHAARDHIKTDLAPRGSSGRNVFERFGIALQNFTQEAAPGVVSGWFGVGAGTLFHNTHAISLLAGGGAGGRAGFGFGSFWFGPVGGMVGGTLGLASFGVHRILTTESRVEREVGTLAALVGAGIGVQFHAFAQTIAVGALGGQHFGTQLGLGHQVGISTLMALGLFETGVILAPLIADVLTSLKTAAIYLGLSSLDAGRDVIRSVEFGVLQEGAENLFTDALLDLLDAFPGDVDGIRDWFEKAAAPRPALAGKKPPGVVIGRRRRLRRTKWGWEWLPWGEE